MPEMGGEAGGNAAGWRAILPLELRLLPGLRMFASTAAAAPSPLSVLLPRLSSLSLPLPLLSRFASHLSVRLSASTPSPTGPPNLLGRPCALPMLRKLGVSSNLTLLPSVLTLPPLSMLRLPLPMLSMLFLLPELLGLPLSALLLPLSTLLLPLSTLFLPTSMLVLALMLPAFMLPLNCLLPMPGPMLPLARMLPTLVLECMLPNRPMLGFRRMELCESQGASQGCVICICVHFYINTVHLSPLLHVQTHQNTLTITQQGTDQHPHSPPACRTACRTCSTAQRSACARAACSSPRFWTCSSGPCRGSCLAAS